jgi:hypothetical protein
MTAPIMVTKLKRPSLENMGTRCLIDMASPPDETLYVSLGAKKLVKWMVR